MEKINVFIVALPTFDSVVNKIKDAVEDAFDFEVPKLKKPCGFKDKFNEDDFTPTNLRVKNPCGNVQPWGVGGRKADENLRFGYQGPCIDEPRRSDYDDREDFEYDHQLFDEYVSAAEDCIARGLEKKSDAPIHRCEAIRKRLNEAPPMNLPLIGETDWWDEDDWDF
jgi:hypothetical protein